MKSSHFEIVQNIEIKQIGEVKGNSCRLEYYYSFSIDLKFFKRKLKKYRKVSIDAINVLSETVGMHGTILIL